MLQRKRSHSCDAGTEEKEKTICAFKYYKVNNTQYFLLSMVVEWLECEYTWVAAP